MPSMPSDRHPFASTDARWSAVLGRDPRASGAFVYAVKTTGIVCRPACASRAPRRENVAFFDTLAEAKRAGFRPCRRCHAGGAASDPARVLAHACALLSSDEASVRAAGVAAAVGMTPASLVRAFRTRLGITPRQYRQRVLAARARAALPQAASVTEALYAAGYAASSRFYDGAGRELGMTPREMRRGGAGRAVHYTARPTSLGTLGIAWTPRGVCDVFFADDPAQVETRIQGHWPAATRARVAVPEWLDRIVAAVERPLVADVPLDIQGTAFQARVWDAVRRIPAGETRSYGEVAAQLGIPRAQRAVARAIAQNRLAVLVPCHRVVGKDGALTGYRWGVARKAELLRRERKTAPPSAPERRSLRRRAGVRPETLVSGRDQTRV